MLSFADNAVAYLGYALPGSVGRWPVSVQGVVIVGALVASALVAQQRLRIVQNAVNTVCLLYTMVILLVVVAGVVYLLPGMLRRRIRLSSAPGYPLIATASIL